jgi:hypothetical protein
MGKFSTSKPEKINIVTTDFDCGYYLRITTLTLKGSYRANHQNPPPGFKISSLNGKWIENG